MPLISGIVAMTQEGVIGYKNQLPWNIPSDLKRFKALTWGHPILMGRKTFESIGKILPGRENIIISSKAHSLHYPLQQHLYFFSSLDLGFEKAKNLATEQGVNEIFVIGGAEIYSQSIPLLDRLYVTLVKKNTEGDAWFPISQLNKFQERYREDHDKPVLHSYIVFERKLK